MQQGLDYSATLGIPFVFASYGDGFIFHDKTLKEGEGDIEKTLTLDEFPSPARRHCEGPSVPETREGNGLAAYNLSVETPGTAMTLVYDDGVFKPQGPVPAAVKNHAVVHVVIVDEAEAANVTVSERWKAIDRLTGLADDEGGPTDVAQNHDKYLYGSLRPR